MIDSQKILVLSVGCINYDCNINFYESLKKIFSHVIHYNYVERFKQIGKVSMNKEILGVVTHERPDYIFFITYQDQITADTLDTIKILGVKTVAWFSDDYWRFERYSKNIAPCIFCSVTTDKNAVEKYKALGLNVVKSQWASNPEHYTRIQLPFSFDVSFIGQNYSKRKENLTFLQNSGIPVSIFGKGFGDYIPFDKTIEIFNSSKINLNFSGSSRSDNIKHIHGRVFEVTVCGGFLLTEYTEGIEEYFEIGKEIDCFRTIEEAVDKIKYYLENEDKRKTLAEAGYIRSLKDHTWTDRLTSVFKEVHKLEENREGSIATAPPPK